jgi:hypothetical protein
LSDSDRLTLTEERSVVGIEQERAEGEALPWHPRNIAVSEVFGILSAGLQYERMPLLQSSPSLPAEFIV